MVYIHVKLENPCKIKSNIKKKSKKKIIIHGVLFHIKIIC